MPQIKIKRQMTNYEGLFAKYVNALVLFYKEFLQVSKKDMNGPIDKWTKDMNNLNQQKKKQKYPRTYEKYANN